MASALDSIATALLARNVMSAARGLRAAPIRQALAFLAAVFLTFDSDQEACVAVRTDALRSLRRLTETEDFMVVAGPVQHAAWHQQLEMAEAVFGG